jgi:hypothetical protein
MRSVWNSESLPPLGDADGPAANAYSSLRAWASDFGSGRFALASESRQRR